MTWSGRYAPYTSTDVVMVWACIVKGIEVLSEKSVDCDVLGSDITPNSRPEIICRKYLMMVKVCF